MGDRKIPVWVMVGVVLIVVLLSIGMVVPNNITQKNNKEKINYTFVLENETMNSITICGDTWHYELINETIPCAINNIIGGITSFDWHESPQDICEGLGGFFPGLNSMNESRSKERYDELMPKCFDMVDSEISETWLNASGCLCQDCSGTFDTVYENYVTCDIVCSEYDCGGGLLVVKK